MVEGRLISILLFASGCTVGGIDLEGRACPCADGYVCNEETQTCFSADAPPMGDPAAAVKPANLEVDWATANAIRWRWSRDAGDDGAELSRYELSVRGEDGSDVLWTSEQNLELGFYAVPRPSGDDGPVEGTITDGLQPNTGYTAELTAYDSADREWHTLAVTGRTGGAPGNTAVMFSEDEVGSTSLPSTFVRTMGGAFQGDYAYAWQNEGCTGACAENLRRTGLQVDNNVGMTTLAGAYMELAMSLTGSSPSFHVQIALTCNGAESRNLYAPLTMRNDGAYRLVQVALTAFQTDMAPLTAEDALAPCTVFGISGLWSDDALVQLDEIVIRY